MCCISMQWIRLEKVYKLMKSFFSNLVFAIELLARNKNYSKGERVVYFDKNPTIFYNNSGVGYLCIRGGKA